MTAPALKLDEPRLLVHRPDGSVEAVVLEERSYSLGRSKLNTLSFADVTTLSRQHLVIEREGPRWIVRDLGSTYGTFVNGERIYTSHVLAPDDRIQAGSLTIDFAGEDQGQTVIFVDDPTERSPASTLTATLSSALRGEKEIEGGTRIKAHMQALIRAGQGLSGHMPLTKLFELILDLSMETAGALRGVVMTIEEGDLQLRAARGEGFHISSHVRDLVLGEKRSLLIQDAQLDEAFSEWASIMQQQVRSILAVPLQTNQDVIGIIYLDSPLFVHEFSTDDLNLLTIMANMAAIRIENARLAEIEEVEALRNREMQQAAEIQQSMLPSVFPPFPERKDFALHASMIPAREVGGDLYDFFLLDQDHLAFAIGDVSGKGVPAALYMAVSATLLRAIAGLGTSPGECLERMNTALARQNVGSMYVTLFYGVLNTRTGELTYANGGHLSPYVFSADGQVRPIEGRSGPLVGLLEDAAYKTLTNEIAPGEAILLYTDGVTEGRTKEGEFFDPGRLKRYLADHGSEPVEQVVAGLQEAVRVFSAGTAQADDITALALRFMPA